MDLYTIVTAIGKTKIANATVYGTKVNFAKLKVGDSNGTYYEPTENQKDLVHTVWEGKVNDVITGGEENPNWIVALTPIPPNVGGFTIREAGIFDEEGDLLAIAKYPESYKPKMEEGSTSDLTIELIFEVSNAASVTLTIDPLAQTASKKDLADLNEKIKKKIEDINTSLNDLMYETAGGTGTAITLSMQPLKQGYNKTFIASANNNRAATTINGKNLYKPNTTTSPNIISGKAYTVWYNSVSDCFFLQASAEGDVVASEVLAGKKFSNDNDTGLVGAMPNNGALNKVLALNETFNLPPGYYSGGKITQNIPNNGAINASLNCGQSKTLPAGYTSGVTITANSLASQTPSNADASKILSGYYAWINGSQVWGNASIQSLGGKRFASGTFGKFSQYETVMANLEFTPSTIVGYSGSWAYLIKTPDSAVSGLFAIRNGNKSANITIGSNSFSLYNTGASGIIDGVTWYAYE